MTTHLTAVPPAPRVILTAAEVSDMTGVPVGTLRYWRSTNHGPRSWKIGRRVAYDLDDVRAWLDTQRAATSRGGR